MNRPDTGFLVSRPRVRRLLVVDNPNAGRRRGGRVERTLALLRAAGATVELATTKKAADAEHLARAATRDRFDAVVVAGGDGTINEALNGLDLATMAFGVIPCGTANVLARELGLPFHPAPLATLLASGPERVVHLGQVNGRRFAMMVGVGLDAHAVIGVSAPLKRAVGKYAYAVSILEAIAAAPAAPCLAVTIEGVAHHAAWVVAAKGRHYAGDFVVAPGANLALPGFEVCLCPEGGRLNALRYIASLGLGALGANRDVRRIRALTLRIDGPSGEPVQADGEIVARLPVDIAAAHEALRVIAPGSA